MKNLFLFSICFFVSCATFPYKYYLGNLDSVYTIPRKVVITPFNFLSNDTTIQEYEIKLEDSIATILKTNGFEVVNSNLAKSSIDTIRESAGGLYDPNTGKLDTKKTERITGEVVSKLTAQFGATCVIFPSIVLVMAKVENNGVRWHGRYIPLSGFFNVSGTISAFSLYVQMYDANGTMVFDNAGGIQAAKRVNAIGQVEELSKDHYFQNNQDLSKALNIVFKPFITTVSAIR